jgi:acyl-CoA hydrolase
VNYRVNGKPARARWNASSVGERKLAIRGRFEMVAVDECGRPTAIAEAEGLSA